MNIKSWAKGEKFVTFGKKNYQSELKRTHNLTYILLQNDIIAGERPNPLSVVIMKQKKEYSKLIETLLKLIINVQFVRVN